jgi:hypothetical protein
MVLVWALAVGLVVGYYRWPPLAEGARGLRALHASWGLGFAAIVGFIAGGVLPELARVVTGVAGRAHEKPGVEAVFRGLVWGALAVIVDAFYSFQAVVYGHDIGLATLAKKTATDMFVFAPTLFVPFTVAPFVSRREGFSARAFFSVWTPKGWSKEVFATYVPNTVFWLPVLLAVYAMPTDLQYPVAALATACWSMIFTFINRT